VRVVEETIADRVGQGGVGEIVVPLGGRELARDDGGAGPGAVLEDLEEVAALGILPGASPQSSIRRTSRRASLPSRRT
jgi:hypothetical protein